MYNMWHHSCHSAHCEQGIASNADALWKSSRLQRSCCNSHTNSICPSDRPAVTFRCFVQRNEDTIVRFSASGRTILLVSGEIKLSRYSQGITFSEGIKVKHSPHIRESLTNNRPYLETV